MSAATLLAGECIDRYPEEAARVLERLEAHDVSALIEQLAPDRGAAVLARMAPGLAAAAVGVKPATATGAIEGLHPNAAAQVLRRMAPEAARDLLDRIGGTFAETVRGLVAYPPDRAGAVCDAAALALAEDLTVEEALDAVRHRPETVVHYLYVLDRDGRLVGAVAPVKLLSAEPATSLESVADPRVARLPADDDLTAVANHPGWDEWSALAVVDEGGRFAGAIAQELARKLWVEQPSRARSALELGVSFAELFWLGLAGMTEGIARVTEKGRDG